MKRGLLIVDRGSREAEAHEELRMISRQATEAGRYDYGDYCFLEVLPPYIDDAMKKCLPKKLDTLTVVPYFLYPGKKIKAAVTEVMRYQQQTQTQILVTKAMSNHQSMVDLVDSRIVSALKRDGFDMPRKEVDVLIIGHGSKDINAQMSLNYVVRHLQTSYRHVSRCFLEIEQPDIETGIKACQKQNPNVLAIVFYFLHKGAHVKRDVNEDLFPALEAFPIPNVAITEHIGTDPRMIQLILDRAAEVEDAD